MRATRLLLGLVLTAAILFVSFTAGAASAQKRAASRGRAVPESLQVLVRFGNETITRADVQRRLDEVPEQFRSNYATPEGRQQLLDRMIEEKLWMSAAQKAGVPQRPAVQRAIDQQKRDYVIRTYLNEVMATNPAPSDSEARVYYDEHLAEYRVPASATVKHIQLKSEAEAKRVLGYAKAKQDWNKLVTRYSTDTLTRSQGGQLGSITKEGVFSSIGRQPALAESVFAIGEGRFGGPWKSDKGWHVMYVESVRPESSRPFEQVRPVILRQLGSTRTQEFYRTKLEDLKKSLRVNADSAAIRGFVNQKKSARDMFKEAQEAGPAAERIQLYQKLLDTWPQSDVAPQARFMIGFIQSEELKDHDAAESTFRTLLSEYPRSELVPSAQWMIDHMRSEEVPAFLNLEGDSIPQAPGTNGAKKSPTTKTPGTKKKP
jgi:parvulin-like peptidyl-prolyl isomerase